MSFAIPWALAALLILPLLVVAYRRRLAGARAARESLAHTGLRAVPGTTARRTRHLAPALLLACLAVLIVASAGPAATLNTPRREGTVMLAFDISNSMRAADVTPDRLSAAKTAAKAFVAAQPRSIRIGVVAFSDSGVVTQQPTDDPAQVNHAIDAMAARGCTSLGQGIYAALQALSGGRLQVDPERLAEDPDSVDIGYLGSSAIVLLSDGQNQADPDPVAMARLASVAGVRLETVGIGSPSGTDVTIGGVTQQTALDEQSLREIAETGSGSYHGAADAAALKAIYESIDLKFVSRRELNPLAPYLALGGLALALLACLVSLARTGRVIAA